MTQLRIVLLSAKNSGRSKGDSVRQSQDSKLPLRLAVWFLPVVLALRKQRPEDCWSPKAARFEGRKRVEN